MNTEKRPSTGAGPSDNRVAEGTLKETLKVRISEDLTSVRVKIWFKNTCSLKKGGFSFLFRSAAQMRRTIFIFPGKISWVKCDNVSSDLLIASALKETEKSIAINVSLCALLNKKEVTLDYPYGNGVRRTIFQFGTEGLAEEFHQALLAEKSRSYIQCSVLTAKQEEALNMSVRSNIANGDALLERFYFSLMNQNAMTGAVETLHTNYRSVIGSEDPSPASFARLLSLVASDPVLYILFLCFSFEVTQSMKDRFKTQTSVQLFDALLTHVHAEVSNNEWAVRRSFLLKQFQYPATTTPRAHALPGSAGLTSPAVFAWTEKFTGIYPKHRIDFCALNSILQDGKILCYACLKHHADNGYVQLVRDVIAAVPSDFLLQAFDTAPLHAAVRVDSTSQTENSQLEELTTGPSRFPFVRLLLHPNLREESVFLPVLNAFRRGKDRVFDKLFFSTLLHEALQTNSGDGNAASTVLKSIFWTEQGDVNVEAVKACPNIPNILLEALLHRAHLPLVDAMRAELCDLLEVLLRLEYAREDCDTLQTLTVILREEESATKKTELGELLQITSFRDHVHQVCLSYLRELEGETAADNAGVTHRVRTHLNALVYGYIVLLVGSAELPLPHTEVVAESPHLEAFLRAMPGASFHQLLAPKTGLRTRLLGYLKQHFRILPEYDEMLSGLNDGHIFVSKQFYQGEVPLLSRPEHLSFSFLHALSYQAVQIKHHLVLVALVAIKLDEYPNLTHNKLRELDIHLSFKVIQELFATVLRFVLNRDRQELLENEIKLQELHGFAQGTLACLTCVRGNEERERAATERAQHILCVEPVAQWREAFLRLKQEYASTVSESPVASPRVREPNTSPSPTLLISRSRSRGGSMGQAPNKPFSSPTSAFRKRVSSIGSSDSMLFTSRSRGDSMSQYGEPLSPRAASATYGDVCPSVPEVDHEEVRVAVPASSGDSVSDVSSSPETSPVVATGQQTAAECPSTEPCSGADSPF